MKGALLSHGSLGEPRLSSILGWIALVYCFSPENATFMRPIEELFQFVSSASNFPISHQ